MRAGAGVCARGAILIAAQRGLYQLMAEAHKPGYYAARHGIRPCALCDCPTRCAGRRVQSPVTSAHPQVRFAFSSLSLFSYSETKERNKREKRKQSGFAFSSLSLFGPSLFSLLSSLRKWKLFLHPRE